MLQRAKARLDRRDDAGGFWINTGWVLGFLVWLGVLLTWHAGFTPAAPFVVIPAVLVFLVGLGNLLGGRSRRPSPRFNRPDPVPISTLRGGAATEAVPGSGAQATAGQSAGSEDGAATPPAGEPGAGR